MTKINDETLRTFVGYHLKRSFNVIQSDLIETLRPFDLAYVDLFGPCFDC